MIPPSPSMPTGAVSSGKLHCKTRTKTARDHEEIIGEDSVTGLVKTCGRKCRMLKTWPKEGINEDTLSGPSMKQIEDLTGCVDPALLSLLTIKE